MTHLSEDAYNIGSYKRKYAFAEYPSVKIYKSSDGRSWGNHLLFGDYIKILDTKIVNNRVFARSRNTNGWVKVDELRKERLLEVNFVDIGQGDGCHIVTPNDKHILIDAGKTDNMNRYLSWRFNLYDRKSPLSFPFTTIISHSDADHYQGFGYVFDNDKIKIDTIYHNGLVERPGANRLGSKKDGYYTNVITTTAQMLHLITDAKNRKGAGSTYCKTLYKVLKHNPNVSFKALDISANYLPNYSKESTVNNTKNSIKILGPITKKIEGKDALKSINNLGKDKNGHSVILKYEFGKSKILLGGDVNTEFGQILQDYYKNNAQLHELQVDVAKACHHGSNHFHYGFIQAINSSATVISSGDDESYAHPRPDTIGALGKCGYGEKPLIFSTELARSTKEITYIKLQGISKMFEDLKIIKKNYKEETEEAQKKKFLKSIKKINKEINSFLTKYGMINLRTDGERMIIAQKLERNAGHSKWDIHKLKYSKTTKRFEQE
ncbi:ComEC/Rec2 family competence protein [Cellulophaga omnivescoria]|uniref:ComEC/Rec2 family competence protein n=1 Tax=Cellulophaga omnivescoria TaxID=1888890 RepID=UPI003EBE1D24